MRVDDRTISASRNRKVTSMDPVLIAGLLVIALSYLVLFVIVLRAPKDQMLDLAKQVVELAKAVLPWRRK